ncbi:putative dehydrogenase [Hydrogenispora ethanolica]|uniref:Putative dehydrogenase n=1 Tax=Hydrogenispora ethanolica TaxID=1082276 RepID=A0A4R1RXV6_HYDET|nr:Gfo/Idh/MocA family oxidoreductase [Hydrogenispora ethanolica]TCL71593.1 putative dehydrogenase [Hydrogenispora ethanolica]
MKTLKLGVLGASRHFITRVLPALQKSEFIAVYGIASRDGEKARETAARYGIPHHFASYEGLLQDPAVDFVYIPLPNDLHAEWIRRSADSGKHIICEKPLAMNAPEAAAAIAYAREKGVQIMEAFMYRLHPQWQRVLELVRFEEIGRISAIHTIFSYANNDPKNIRNIRANGGGALYDIGCYAVSTARFVMQAEPSRVFCAMNVDPQFQTDVLTNGVLDFGTARALFSVSTQSFPQQRVQVFGTGGSITVEIPFNMPADVPAKVTVQTGVATRILEIGPADQYRLEFEAFGQAIANGAALPIPAEDAVNNMKVLDALFRSAASGQWETLPG